MELDLRIHSNFKESKNLHFGGFKGKLFLFYFTSHQSLVGKLSGASFSTSKKH